ncbi:DivIVA domain-containing protein [Thalassiella azotivora]
MALTPEAVVEKRFQATKFREGYDQDEVDDFLDEVVNELRRLNAENDELRSKLAACERRVGELTRAGATGGQPVAKAKPAPEPEPVKKPEPTPAPAPAPAPVAAAVGGQSPEAATGMLALAQKLHDEHVRSGEQKRDQLINEAETHAARLVAEAEQKQRETLGSLERERSLLERKIDELRAFERDYRSRLKSYLESQLRDLEAKGSIVPGRAQQPGQGEPGYSFGTSS